MAGSPCWPAGWLPPTWLGQLVILDADAVTAWDLRGLFERMAQTAYLHGSTQHMVQRCELVELLLLMDQIVAERRTAPPSATSALVAKAVAFFAGQLYRPEPNRWQPCQIYPTPAGSICPACSKTYTMESVHGYLTNLRMQHCRRAIAAGASVLDACNASGFTNYTSFLKTFRSLYGITPSEYRSQLRRTPERVHSTP